MNSDEGFGSRSWTTVAEAPVQLHVVALQPLAKGFAPRPGIAGSARSGKSSAEASSSRGRRAGLFRRQLPLSCSSTTPSPAIVKSRATWAGRLDIRDGKDSGQAKALAEARASPGTTGMVLGPTSGTSQRMRERMAAKVLEPRTFPATAT